MLLLGSVFTHLILAVTLILAATVAGLMAYHFAKARLRERAPHDGDPLYGAEPATGVEQRARSAEEIAQIRSRIEALMEQQHVRSETQGQHLAQKLDEIRTHMGTQDRKMDGIKSELRHEIRRRDTELDGLREQLAGALDAFWKSMPALEEQGARPALAAHTPPAPAPSLPAEEATDPESDPRTWASFSPDTGAVLSEPTSFDVSDGAADPFEGAPLDGADDVVPEASERTTHGDALPDDLATPPHPTFAPSAFDDLGDRQSDASHTLADLEVHDVEWHDIVEPASPGDALSADGPAEPEWASLLNESPDAEEDNPVGVPPVVSDDFADDFGPDDLEPEDQEPATDAPPSIEIETTWALTDSLSWDPPTPRDAARSDIGNASDLDDASADPADPWETASFTELAFDEVPLSEIPLEDVPIVDRLDDEETGAVPLLDLSLSTLPSFENSAPITQVPLETPPIAEEQAPADGDEPEALPPTPELDDPFAAPSPLDAGLTGAADADGSTDTAPIATSAFEAPPFAPLSVAFEEGARDSTRLAPPAFSGGDGLAGPPPPAHHADATDPLYPTTESEKAAAPEAHAEPAFLDATSDAEEEPVAPAATPSAEVPASEHAPEVRRGDDLTVVSGITPELQQKLNDAGITTLDEIARWSRADARRVSDLVGVPEEVIMHRWIFEAQSVLFEHYQTVMTQ